MSILEEYKSSTFYAKYKNTYFSDSILKKVFGIKLSKHRVYLRSYEAVYKKNIEVMTDFFEGYISEASSADDYTKWLMLYSIYIDPDTKANKNVENIECSADGLISITRIHDRYGIQPKFVKEFEECRRTPIIHFPKEVNGINTLRKGVFGDRIDHTLFDLKRLCEGYEDCRLKLAYNQPKTSEWLKYFDYDFSKIVDWMKIDKVFVSDNKIFDLEKNDGSFISEYKDVYGWKWSGYYYENLKSKILQFENGN